MGLSQSLEVDQPLIQMLRIKGSKVASKFLRNSTVQVVKLSLHLLTRISLYLSLIEQELPKSKMSKLRTV